MNFWGSLRHPLLVAVLRISLNRGLGQAILFGVTLLSTSFYSPADFGLAGTFFSITALLAAVASMRFEYIAIIANGIRVKNKLFGLAYLALIFFFSVPTILAIIYVFVFGISELNVMCTLLPASIVANALTQQVVPAQCASPQLSKQVARMAQVVAIGSGAVQLLGAYVSPNALTLLISRLLGCVVGVVFVWHQVSEGFRLASAVRFRDLRRFWPLVANEFSFGGMSTILSVIGTQTPLYYFIYNGLQKEAGVYWLSYSVIFIPYTIIAGSLRPLLLNEFTTVRGEGFEGIVSKTRLHSIIALPIGILSFFIFSAFSALISHLILSEKWELFGNYTIWMSLLLIGIVAQTPVSIASTALRMQRGNFLYNVLQVVLRTAAMILVAMLSRSIEYVVPAFCVSGCVVALGYAVLMNVSISRSKTDVVAA